MAIQLDTISRQTLHRFAWKVNIAVVISLFSRTGHLLSVSHCLQLYAALMAGIAIFTRQRFSRDSFNHWSEALWLAFAAAGLQLLSSAAL
jgi:hypothetical protein